MTIWPPFWILVKRQDTTGELCVIWDVKPAYLNPITHRLERLP